MARTKFEQGVILLNIITTEAKVAVEAATESRRLPLVQITHLESLVQRLVELVSVKAEVEK